jgi:ABC-type nitrate/sulfonate/bicarbonate transport system substrate-binding protein
MQLARPTSRVGIVNAYVNGASDVVLIGSMKNIMTQSILAKPDVTKLAQLKGKQIGVTRIGSNTQYFTVQAVRRAGMNTDKDITFVQTGAEAETLGALVSGRIDAATLLPPSGGKARSGIPSCRIWTGYRHPLRRIDDYDAPLGHRQARSGPGL